MYKDEIITEVWRNRDSYTKKHHHSLAEIVADLQIRQKNPGRKLIDRRDRAKSFVNTAIASGFTQTMGGNKSE